MEYGNPYLWGVIGSVMVEVTTAVRLSVKIEGRWPERYKQPFFLVTRTLLALFAGLIPVAVDATTFLNCLIVGASAPLFIDKASRGVGRDGD